VRPFAAGDAATGIWYDEPLLLAESTEIPASPEISETAEIPVTSELLEVPRRTGITGIPEPSETAGNPEFPEISEISEISEKIGGPPPPGRGGGEGEGGGVSRASGDLEISGIAYGFACVLIGNQYFLASPAKQPAHPAQGRASPASLPVRHVWPRDVRFLYDICCSGRMGQWLHTVQPRGGLPPS
jgi:hypothetical protein